MYWEWMCHTRMRHVMHEWVMSHMNASCHTWMHHGTHECIMAHMNEACHTWMCHFTYSCVTRLIHVWHASFVRHRTHPYVTCLIHAYATWLIHVWHDSFARDITPQQAPIFRIHLYTYVFCICQYMCFIIFDQVTGFRQNSFRILWCLSHNSSIGAYLSFCMYMALFVCLCLFV